MIWKVKSLFLYREHLLMQHWVCVINLISFSRCTFKQYRILYTVVEYDPLLDSSNLSMEDWATIAKDISTRYHNFIGFVILHGTDTMSYTASALSFMFENLGKTVILTGSQVQFIMCCVKCITMVMV